MKLNVSDEEIRFKIDTGAQWNVIPEYNMSKKKRKQPTKAKITGYGSVRVPLKGARALKIRKNSKNIDSLLPPLTLNL